MTCHTVHEYFLYLHRTDELQLVDAGVGHALKTEMAHLHDEWLSKDDNLELWTTATLFPVWRKRALVTWLAAQAWENVCVRFDFEAAATRLGMRMTIDGSGDELIRMQGVERYFFCDDDGGESDSESDKPMLLTRRRLPIEEEDEVQRHTRQDPRASSSRA